MATKTKNPKTDNSELRDFNPDEDEIGRRVLEANDVTYTFKAYDPYGLVKISPSIGVLPKELSGQYTSMGEAERAVEAYVTAKKFKKG